MINRSAGFTLLELLVVVAIVGMLSAVVFTSTSESKDKAREVNSLKEVRKFKIALFLYEMDTSSKINCPANSDCTNMLIANPGVNGWNGPYLAESTHPWGGKIIVGRLQVGPLRPAAMCPMNARICQNGEQAIQNVVSGRCIQVCPEDPVQPTLTSNEDLIYLTNDRPGFGANDNNAKIPTASMLNIDKVLDDGDLDSGLIIQVNTGNEADSGQLIIKPTI